MSFFRALLLLIFISFAQAGSVQEREKLMGYYLSLDNNIKSYLRSDLEMLDENKEGIKKRIVNTLARDMVYSAVYINEEYITNEEDVFNNEMMVIMSRIFKSELADLNERYSQNVKKLQALNQVLLDIKKKFDAIEEAKEEQSFTNYTDAERHAKADRRAEELIDILSKEEASGFLSIDLDAVAPPLESYTVLKSSKDGYSLLKPGKSRVARSVLDGKVLFAEKSDTMGYIMVIGHRANLFSLYSNLASIKEEIKIGSTVEILETIGLADNPLYFKLTHNKSVVEPALFLDMQ